MRITFAILNATTGVQLTGDEVTGSSSDLFALQDELTAKVSAALELESRNRRTPPPSGLEASSEQEAYIQAVGHLQRYDKPTEVRAAIALLEPLAARRPQSAIVHAALGRAYLYELNLTRENSWAARAADEVAKAGALAHDLPEVDTTSGELLLRTGKPAEAVTAFRRALSLQPNNYDALLGLARAYDAAGDPAPAEATYRRAIALQPEYWSGYSKLAGHFYGRGEYAQAAATLEKVTRLSPDNSRAFSNLGGTYELLGRFDAALDAYKRAIAIEPTHLAYSNLGTLQFYLGRYAESAAAYEKAAALTPAHPEIWANLGEALSQLPGREGDARSAFLRCVSLASDQLRINPQDPLVRSKYALCLARTGRPEDAREQSRQALVIDPRNPEWMYNAALIAAAAGRRDEALSWIHRAVDAGASKAHLTREPAFAALREDRAFREAIR